MIIRMTNGTVELNSFCLWNHMKDYIRKKYVYIYIYRLKIITIEKIYLLYKVLIKIR